MYHCKSALILFFLILIAACKNELPVKHRFYVGTYTQKEGHVDGKGDGIYEIEIDIENDTFKIIKTLNDLVNPSFLTLSNDRKHLYSVNEIGINDKNFPGRISHFEIDSIRPRKAQEAGSYGNSPCHIALSPSQNLYVVSNYLGGQLAYGKLDASGKLSSVNEVRFTGKGKIENRQEASHLHMGIFSKSGSKLIVLDLGADSIHVLDVKGDSVLAHPRRSYATAPGDGPRHGVLNASGNQLFILNELSNTVRSYAFDEQSGNLTEINSLSTLPQDFEENNLTADIHLSIDGKFLYCSNRGHNSIARFGVSPDGKLNYHGTTSTEGEIPRNFTITRDRKYMLVGNQNSDNIVIFKIKNDGNLEKFRNYALKTPVCIVEI